MSANEMADLMVGRVVKSHPPQWVLGRVALTHKGVKASLRRVRKGWANGVREALADVDPFIGDTSVSSGNFLALGLNPIKAKDILGQLTGREQDIWAQAVSDGLYKIFARGRLESTICPRCGETDSLFHAMTRCFHLQGSFVPQHTDDLVRWVRHYTKCLYSLQYS